jgi:ATP-dependent Clp protease ATP-binding subunit ClpB
MLDPIIGREDEVDRCIHVLARRTKNNPVLVGSPGVGKTAIVEGLAMRIAQNDVPVRLQKARVISLDLGLLLAGAKFRGAFEERVKQIMNEVEASEGKTIIFIDEIHMLVGAGRTDGSMDAANMLKPLLARGKFTCIGATTDDEYREYIEKDQALERRFSPVRIDEPRSEQAVAMIRGLKEKYELHHKLRILNSAIHEAVRLAKRYVTARFLPDSAIDLIDEAAAMKQSSLSSKPLALRKLEEKLLIAKMELQVCEDDGTRIELDKRAAELDVQIAELDKKWRQEREAASALHAKKEELEQAKYEVIDARRDGRLDRAAELKYGVIPRLESEIKVIESESQDSVGVVTPEDIARVISMSTGIPVSRLVDSEKRRLIEIESEMRARVVGQEGAITAVANAIRRAQTKLSDPERPLGCFLFVGPTGVGKTELCRVLAEVLFDDPDSLIRIDMSEFNQEHNIARLIGAPPGHVGYDKGGYLTELVRRRPYQVILCDEVEKAHPSVYNIFLQIMSPGRLTDGHGRSVSFKNSILILTSNLGMEDAEDDDEDVRDVVSNYFPREFINRLDQIVVFDSLSVDHIKQIVPNYVKRLAESLKKEWGIELSVTDSAIDWLAQNGYNYDYGARPLKYLFERAVVNPLSTKILSNELNKDVMAKVDCVDDVITITGVPLSKMIGK